jgi:hypothetical protein
VTHLVIALIVFAIILGSTLLGLFLRDRLPDHHLSDESSSAVKLGVGLVATIAALVLGLLISSAKSSFDTVSTDLIHNAANVVRLDSVLGQYGEQTAALRGTLKHNYAGWIQLLESPDARQRARLDNPEIIGRMSEFQSSIEALRPASDAQRELQARALRISDEVFSARSLLLLQREGALPMPLLIILVFWLAMIFGTFGLLAPRNGTTVGAYLLCALSASGAIFLILEMDTPLDGIVRVSVEPMREALSRLGQ